MITQKPDGKSVDTEFLRRNGRKYSTRPRCGDFASRTYWDDYSRLTFSERCQSVTPGLFRHPAAFCSRAPRRFPKQLNKHNKQTAASIVQEAAARCETALMHISVSTHAPVRARQKALLFQRRAGRGGKRWPARGYAFRTSMQTPRLQSIPSQNRFQRCAPRRYRNARPRPT